MNKIILMCRLTADPEIRYSSNENQTCVAKFNLAVDRRFKREGEPTADFFQIVAFGRLGEFAQNYLQKGTKVVLDGELRNNNYTNKDGQKVYGFQIVANSIEFAESKRAAQENQSRPAEPEADNNGFMGVPDDIEESLPFV
jgi:single-strand DNA-binding protein